MYYENKYTYVIVKVCSPSMLFSFFTYQLAIIYLCHLASIRIVLSNIYITLSHIIKYTLLNLIGKYWIPFVWSANLIKTARRQNLINDDFLMKTIIDVSSKLYCIACCSIRLYLYTLHISVNI